jgi:hypothetical protein
MAKNKLKAHKEICGEIGIDPDSAVFPNIDTVEIIIDVIEEIFGINPFTYINPISLPRKCIKWWGKGRELYLNKKIVPLVLIRIVVNGGDYTCDHDDLRRLAESYNLGKPLDRYFYDRLIDHIILTLERYEFQQQIPGDNPTVNNIPKIKSKLEHLQMVIISRYKYNEEERREEKPE